MNVIEQLRNFVASLEEKEFYTYLGAILTGVVLVVFLMFFQYYRQVNDIIERIDTIDEQRNEAKRILTTAQRVQQQRAEVDTLLGQDPNFKIGGYFEDVLSKLKLTDKKTTSDRIEHTQIDHEGKYKESIRKEKLTGMNMKQVCELLNELEQNKRIFIKELDISKSNKQNKALDISLTIATLEPKLGTSE